MHDIFYFTDIHGNKPLFDEIMKWIKDQDSSPTIIYGGDAMDRGEHGYEITKTLLEDPQVIYLKGNHENLFVNAAYELILDIDSYLNKGLTTKEIADKIININNNELLRLHHTELHLYNGGQPTLLNWIQDGAPKDILKKLSALPVVFSFVGKKVYDFSHAGGTYHAFQDYNNAFAIENLLWDRNHFLNGWADDHILIHGHTPTTHLPHSIVPKGMTERNIRPVWWITKSGLKCDMDTGAIWTNRIWVLNINTSIMTSFIYNPYTKITTIGTENYKLDV